jgi:hypothetical protein
VYDGCRHPVGGDRLEPIIRQYICRSMALTG